MKTIRLKPVEATKKILTRLEKRGLIGTFKPTPKILKLGSRKKGGVDTVYSSSPRFGSHKLICIRQDDTSKVILNSHPDNEEFIMINSAALRFKPFYIIIGLCKHKELEVKAKSKRLSKDNLIALRLKYNDPETCIFTMLKNVPHCQITLPGRGKPPIFFVTEPTNLSSKRVKLPGYNFKVF